MHKFECEGKDMIESLRKDESCVRLAIELGVERLV